MYNDILFFASDGGTESTVHGKSIPMAYSKCVYVNM